MSGNKYDIDIDAVQNVGHVDSQVYDELDKHGSPEGKPPMTLMKKRIFEVLAQNGELSNREVAEIVDCSVSYPARVRREFNDIIKRRAKELGNFEKFDYDYQPRRLGESN